MKNDLRLAFLAVSLLVSTAMFSQTYCVPGDSEMPSVILVRLK